MYSALDATLCIYELDRLEHEPVLVHRVRLVTVNGELENLWQIDTIDTLIASACVVVLCVIRCHIITSFVCGNLTIVRSKPPKGVTSV
jgi:hypothetical protein